MNLLRSFSTQAAMPLSARIFLGLLRRISIGHIVLVTPDGGRCVFGDPLMQPAAHLAIHDWRACRAMLRAGDIGFAQAYRAQWLDTPDPYALVRLAIRNEAALSRTVAGGFGARCWHTLRHRLRLNTRPGSRRNIHAHYDIGNAFYGLWLDPTWTYSSGWFDGDAELTLEAAQHRKYQRIVETLGLKAGMRVLEIGCGWGGFARHAARLGIHVHGVTISPSQHAFAMERIACEDLSEFVNIELRDYRDLRGEYDAVVSIEMFEAVGEAFWHTYFNTLRRCLAPGARALVQSITIDDARFCAYRASSDFIRETIFPGGMLPSPERFVSAASRAGLSAHASLSFGADYARTLRCWRNAFEARADAVRAQGFDESFVRTWRLYLAYCEAGFDEKRTDVMHFVVSRGA
ncbi:cyclopropane-fatty-acyl-phospholipid synthase [Caballeronia hypogeia]|uniref:Cyclopropane-fatty-acyl-phospholipid synthase n=1 Tax=Caballeronia hypogeia TaxID=1777140 RepID=A0A158AA08_9BURK|nr:cyclopropane-fatty-acyl-phospholipid synthase family protein [Caballeronia hypogeia]SAK53927.1 cyclopropane-fatty-acyl-phospholipid synthase [Caballeronia hypogeia]